MRNCLIYHHDLYFGNKIMVYFFLLLLLIFLGIVNKRSKPVLILLYLMLFFICTHITAGFDLENNELVYNNLLATPDAESGAKSLIYSLFIFFIKDLGFDFYHFRVVCYLIWSIPVFLFFLKFSKYPTFVAASCVFFPMLTFSTQIRNALAVSFIYIALFVLLRRRDKWGILGYIVIILFAGLIHNAALFYLLALIAVSKIKNSVLFRYSIIISFTFLLFFSLLKDYLAEFSNESYFSVYFEGKVKYWFLRLLFLIPCIISNLWFLTKAVKIERNLILRGESKDMDTYNFTVFAMRFHYALFILMPLLFISDHFYRIFQNMYILSVIGIVNASTFYNYEHIKYARSFRILFLLFYFYVIFSFNFVDGGLFLGFRSISF